MALQAHPARPTLPDVRRARLASTAAAGEVLVTVAAAQAAGLDPTLERKPLELRGKHLVTEVVSLRADGRT